MAVPHAMFGEWYGPVYLPALGGAAPTQTDPVFLAPINCVVLGVAVVPQAACVGADGACKNYNLIDAHDDGTGVAEIGHLDMVTGVDFTANMHTDIPLDVAAGHALHTGDVLVIQREEVGGSPAQPACLVYLALRENGV